MSALVAALLGLLPEAFAFFKGGDKKDAAENFALAAIAKAQQLTGIVSDTDELAKLQQDPALVLLWQSVMNAVARTIAEMFS